MNALYEDFELPLLRRSFLLIMSIYFPLLVATLSLQTIFQGYQPAFLLVTIIRSIELMLDISALIWAWKPERFKPVPASLLVASYGFTALIILGVSGGNYEVSSAMYFLGAAQMLLAFGFFMRSAIMVSALGAMLVAGVLLMFFWQPDDFFPQSLSEEAIQFGLRYNLLLGIPLITALAAGGNFINARLIGQTRRHAERLRCAAYTDGATGLANGVLLEQHLDELLIPGSIILAGFRLDGLDSLNERHGVGAANSILKEIVSSCADEMEYLSRIHPEYATPKPMNRIYRLESNLFVFPMTLPVQTDSGDAWQTVLTEVLKRNLPDPVDGMLLGFHGAYAGCPGDVDDPRQLPGLLLAMLHQRRTLRSGVFSAFDQILHKEYKRQEELIAAMPAALAAGEFRLAYQPKVDSVDESVSGFEALARWMSPRFGPVSPGEFIPLAERSSLISSITMNLLSLAVDFLSDLDQSRQDKLRISFNLSPEVMSADSMSRMVEYLERSGLGPRFDFEITEGSSMRLNHSVLEQFNRLRTLGVIFSIDDFGTGFSNLGYLQNLNAEVLKIDKSFIDGLPDSGKNGKLVTAIISMAEALDMTVIAEGVETRAQLDFLRGLGCRQIQGYYYSKPLEKSEAVRFHVNPPKS
ncbi:MAG: EAL domain-containing protein [Syntrophaceae bacterium]|nr:EAL domain-containing protein [Syntrophaceae bacterium]